MGDGLDLCWGPDEIPHPPQPRENSFRDQLSSDTLVNLEERAGVPGLATKWHRHAP